MAKPKKKNIGVELEFKLPFRIEKKEGWFIACCPVLDVYSQGKTEDKAKRNLIESLQAFLFSCIERGTLDAVLKECGFKYEKITSARKHPRFKKENYVDIPLFMLAPPPKDEHCHA